IVLFQNPFIPFSRTLSKHLRASWQIFLLQKDSSADSCITKKRLLLHNQYAIKVSLFHHDTDRQKLSRLTISQPLFSASYSLLRESIILKCRLSVNCFCKLLTNF